MNIDDLDAEVLERLLDLGEEFDAELVQRLKDRGLPTADQILSGMIVSIKDELSFPVQQMFMNDFCRALGEVEAMLLTVQFDRMILFITKHFQPEMVAFTIRNYVEYNTIPIDSKTYEKFQHEYKQLLQIVLKDAAG